MSNISEDSETFHMAFNAGIAAITQAMQKYDGVILKALVNSAHDFSAEQLADLLKVPMEDIALLVAKFAEPMEELVDKVVQEVENE